MKDPTTFRFGAVVHAVSLCTRNRTWLYAPCGAKTTVSQAGKPGEVNCPECMAWLAGERKEGW